MNKHLTVFFIFLMVGAFLYGSYLSQKEYYREYGEMVEIQNVLRVCEASEGWMWNVTMNTTSVSYECTAVHCNDGKCRFDYLKKVSAEKIDGRWLVEV